MSSPRKYRRVSYPMGDRPSSRTSMTQHVVNWKKFRTALKRRTDIDWEALENAGSNNYGMVLKRVK